MSIDSIPPVLLGLGIILTLSVIIELGYRAGKRIGSAEPGLSRHPVEASVTTAILGLMAFMLGFSFASAANRFSNRRDLTLADANTAGTLYLRADFLPADQIEQTRHLIREYVQVRAGAGKQRTMEAIFDALERSSVIQKELWAIAVAARQQSDNVSLNLFIASLNELIDTDAKRQAMALTNRFPAVFWGTLAFLGVLSTTMLGISSGLHGRRSRLASTALIVSFSVVTILIVDLDRPIRSLFKLPDVVTEKALESMKG